jgi:hypothetical protein
MTVSFQILSDALNINHSIAWRYIVFNSFISNQNYLDSIS